LTRQRRSYDTSIQTNNDLPDDRSSLPGSILEHIADAIVYADARRERSGAGAVPPPSCSATGPQMDAGGLLSYGASFAAMGRRTAVLSIALREVRDLPVEQLTKFETRDQPQHRQNIQPQAAVPERPFIGQIVPKEYPTIAMLSETIVAR
jgi:hypothetical protein